METVVAPNAWRSGTGPPACGGVAGALDPVEVHLMLAWQGRLLFLHWVDTDGWGFPAGRLRARESVVDGACRIGVEQVAVEVSRPGVRVVDIPRGGHAGSTPGIFVSAGQFRGVPVVTDRRAVDRLRWCVPTRPPEPAARHVLAAVDAWRRALLLGGEGGSALGGECGSTVGSGPAHGRHRTGALVEIHAGTKAQRR